MQDELGIINDMLRATGTSRLTAEDTQHPDYYTAQDTLNRVSRSVQAMGMWYNTTYPTLLPNTEGEIIVPSNTLHCDPLDVCKNYSLRRRKLYDLTNRTYVFTGEVKVKLVTVLDIEEMPYAAVDYIRATAKYEFYVDDDGSEPKLTRYATERDRCWVALYRENVSNSDYNHFNSPAASVLRNGSTRSTLIRPQE